MDIENVPHSPNTGHDPTEVFNPLGEDFTAPQGGIDYTIPANSKASFPEFRAYHLAFHLAKKIVAENFYEDLKQESFNPLNPNAEKWKTMIRAIPDIRVKNMMGWVLNPKGSSPEESRVEEAEKEVKKRTEGTLTSQVDLTKLTWQELKKVASEKGFYNPKMTRKEVLEKLNG